MTILETLLECLPKDRPIQRVELTQEAQRRLGKDMAIVGRRISRGLTEGFFVVVPGGIIRGPRRDLPRPHKLHIHRPKKPRVEDAGVSAKKDYLQRLPALLMAE